MLSFLSCITAMIFLLTQVVVPVKEYKIVHDEEIFDVEDENPCPPDRIKQIEANRFKEGNKP